VFYDGSTDGTTAAATRLGAHVVRLPFNLGIGGAVQTGFRYAFENGFTLAVRVDGDGQHDPSQLGTLLGPVLDDGADIVVGSRFAPDSRLADAGYRSSRSRRIGISILAGTLSILVGRRVTDPTSGFQALNRLAIALFAADYPHDYPEVEAALMVHKHQLRMAEVPVQMRERSAGRSSIGTLASVYYMVKVMLALFVGLFRKNVTPLEELK
jgi:glycosyltransferase involved in cell wall biosynthesis